MEQSLTYLTMGIVTVVSYGLATRCCGRYNTPPSVLPSPRVHEAIPSPDEEDEDELANEMLEAFNDALLTTPHPSHTWIGKNVGNHIE